MKGNIMKHLFSAKLCAAVAALAIVAMICPLASAQQDQGRRGRGGREGGFGGPGGGAISAVRLATLDAVAKALNLTDEQKEKVKTINDEMRDKVRAAFQDGGGREKMEELSASYSAKVNDVLDKDQQKRLMGILVQVAGANATLDPAVAKELNITDDQKAKLREARESNMQAMRDAFAGARDGNREEMRAKFEKLRDESNQKLMAVLTADQQAQLESLKGEKVEIDMAQLRGPGGGFGGRQGRGGEGGGRPGGRNRDQSNESKSGT
jgi:Spy/CpxP family protein refolding chaperone